MTVCGLLRLDGTDARRSTLTAMLAASVDGLPAARAVHLDGPFGVVTAPASPSRSMPGVVVERDGLVVVVDADSDSDADADSDSDESASGAGSRDPVRRLAADFRVRGDRSLAVAAGAVRVTLVWQPDLRRLVVSRDGWAASELLTWSDGQIFVFGTEAAHLVAAGLPRVATVGSIGRQSPRPRLASVRRLAPGDLVTVNVTAGRPRRGRRVLRLVRPLGEPAG